jgi:small conductance mechanosensitive channel
MVEMQQLTQTALNVGAQIAVKIVGALLLWFAGRWAISAIIRLLGRGLERQQVDRTLGRYLMTSLATVLNVALVIAILGLFGVETTTFAALIAAGGVAIGVAWGGLLANFAAGAFLVVLRPFKVGDAIMAAGVTGTVDTIGLFGTTINTPDNVRTIIGNNRIFSDTIYNYSANGYRRVDLTAAIDNSVDHMQAIQLLRRRVLVIPHVLSSPPPEIDVLQFTPNGPVLCVRPFCSNQHYGQVFFDTNRAIRETFLDAGFRAPTPHVEVHGQIADLAQAAAAGVFPTSSRS